MEFKKERTLEGSDVLQPFSEFLEGFKKKLKTVFYERADINDLGIRRGMPPFVMREIMSTNPFTTFIPKVFGGRGGKIKEGIELVEAASYESLALGLTFGINWALFLQPVSKYAHADVQRKVFQGFLKDRKMGGLMITEPDFGSDALNMQTSYVDKGSYYHLKGTKHWAGLTGWADYWLLTARQQTKQGSLMRDIDFFVSDNNHSDQIIEVEEYYENLGLYQIPYGRNKIDAKIPKIYKLEPKTNGVALMLDTLHRSRMEIPAMALGFIRRMMDEAITHCQERLVGAKSLFSYDQVQQRLSRIQSAFTITSAICAHSADNVATEIDLMPEGLKANSVKTVVTDLMQESAQQLFQLVGAKAYRLNHIAGRAIVDSRPFQIFEGSNDILYAQISEAVVKMMRRGKENNLFQFLKGFQLTKKSSGRLKDMLNFNLDFKMPQRKLVELGRVLSRIVSMEMVIDLGLKGFQPEMVNNSLSMMSQELSQLMNRFAYQNNTQIIVDYSDNGLWNDFVKA